jgi:hypothetical protein
MTPEELFPALAARVNRHATRDDVARDIVCRFDTRSSN